MLCRRYTLWSYPAGLTIADPPGKQKLKYRRVYSYHFHTTIAESIHTTPNSIQCPFNKQAKKKNFNNFAKRISFAENRKLVAEYESSAFDFMLSRVHRAHFFQLQIRKKRDILSEKRESGMAVKKREFTPESGNVDTYAKMNARNNIIRKLATSKWGCKASTLRPSRIALCYSAAEYACPVWARSTHAHKLNPALHDCCRIISGWLKLMNLDSVHLLAGIAPPHIRRTVACRMERTGQTTDTRHQLFHRQAAASRLKSRKSFMRTITALGSSARSSRLRLWKDNLTDVPASVKMGLEVAESLSVGSGEDWLC